MKFDGNKWMSAWELMLAAVFIVFLALYADYIKHLKFPYTFSSETLIFDGDATYALGNNTDEWPAGTEEVTRSSENGTHITDYYPLPLGTKVGAGKGALSMTTYTMAYTSIHDGTKNAPMITEQHYSESFFFLSWIIAAFAIRICARLLLTTLWYQWEWSPSWLKNMYRADTMDESGYQQRQQILNIQLVQLICSSLEFLSLFRLAGLTNEENMSDLYVWIVAALVANFANIELLLYIQERRQREGDSPQTTMTLFRRGSACWIALVGLTFYLCFLFGNIHWRAVTLNLSTLPHFQGGVVFYVKFAAFFGAICKFGLPLFGYGGLLVKKKHDENQDYMFEAVNWLYSAADAACGISVFACVYRDFHLTNLQHPVY